MACSGVSGHCGEAASSLVEKLIVLRNGRTWEKPTTESRRLRKDLADFTGRPLSFVVLAGQI